VFNPNYQISAEIANALVRIELAKEQISDIPITTRLLASLRESAKLASTHYSTKIEGNRLSELEVKEVIGNVKHFKDRKRDEKEVLGYYEGLDQISQWSANRIQITQEHIQRLHALVMGDKRVKFSPFRDGQNVIRESFTGRIVYMPPEAKDIAKMMDDLIVWLKSSKILDIPDPIRAAITHYQFATIHPYYDGNGRTARLLTNLVLYLGGYDLNGIYSLEEYYAQNLNAYYAAISVGDSHNFYFGRSEADITGWIKYFCEGMATSFENVKKNALSAHIEKSTKFDIISGLDSRQRRLLAIYKPGDFITSVDIQKSFNIRARNAAYLLHKWVSTDFIKTVDNSKKNRKYRLN
jgi:Fic family protein